MTRVYDVLTLATLSIHRDAARKAMSEEDYEHNKRLAWPVLELLVEKHPEHPPLELVRLAAHLVVAKTHDEVRQSLFMVSALEWLEAQNDG